MKTDAVSDGGSSISQLLGWALMYTVVTAEAGKIVARKTRDKMGHAPFAGDTHEEHGGPTDPRGHGFDPAAQSRHSRMAAAIADCDVLLARGMGSGAYESMRQAGIRPIITDIPAIDQAIQAVISGEITHHVEKLH